MPHSYKYLTSEVGDTVLRNGTLRWSPSAILNDPYDMQAPSTESGLGGRMCQGSR
jgi:hypothetical protein